MQTRRNHLHAVPERRYRHIREAKERVGSINSKFGKWQVHNHSFYHEMIMSLVQDGVIPKRFASDGRNARSVMGNLGLGGR